MLTIAFATFLGVGVFSFLWWFAAADAKQSWKGQHLTFTPPDTRGKPVPFDSRHERYMKVAEVVTTITSASIVFIPSRLSDYPKTCAFTLVLLGFVILYCVGFMAALTYFYERSLYFKNSYLPWKYGLAHALGFGALFCFVLAYMSLAARVAWGVNSKEP